jgi:hypothetical protein
MQQQEKAGTPACDDDMSAHKAGVFVSLNLLPKHYPTIDKTLPCLMVGYMNRRATTTL